MKATKTSEYFAQYALIILGSVLFAAGFQFFLYPNSIIVGGVSGIAMIINYLTDLPVGVMTAVYYRVEAFRNKVHHCVPCRNAAVIGAR